MPFHPVRVANMTRSPEQGGVILEPGVEPEPDIFPTHSRESHEKEWRVICITPTKQQR